MNEGVAEDDDNDPVDEPTYIPHIDELQIDIQTDKLKSPVVIKSLSPIVTWSLTESEESPEKFRHRDKIDGLG